MGKRVVRGMCIGALVAVGFVAGSFLHHDSIEAQTPSECKVPKSYGTLKAGAAGLAGFEASDGTIRWVNIDDRTCKVYLTVTRP
jgi:hypothetical protein